MQGAPTKYNVIVADPPWSFGDKLPGKSRGAEKNYEVMAPGDIGEFLPKLHVDGVRYPVDDDAILFLWRVASQVEEAAQIARAWGFTPKSEIVWVKQLRSIVEFPNTPVEEALHFGMGRYVRMSHEVCMIAARGKALPLIGSHSVRSIFFAPVGRHSEKPAAFFDLVEKLCPNTRRLELFARRRRDGWTCLGNELPE